MTTQISEHFSLEDAASTSHSAYQEMNLTKALDYLDNLKAVAETFLERVHAERGTVIITSWFRFSALNSKVGGGRASQHLTGSAVDHIVDNGEPEDLFEWYQANFPPNLFHQLILEFAPSAGSKWVHAALATGTNDGQVFTLNKETGERVWISGKP